MAADLRPNDKAYYCIQRDRNRKISVVIVKINLDLDISEFYTVRVVGHRSSPYKRGEYFTTGYDWLIRRGVNKKKDD